MPIKIFCCYAHEDEPLLNQLKAHLSPLLRQGLIDVWYDGEISAGTDWEQQIKEQLNTAQIILLLVSPDFMNSDYCYSVEMKRAMERHERGDAIVIPVILRPVYWQGVLGRLQALPKDALPITDLDWHGIDRAFFNVTEGIRKVVMGLSTKTPIVITQAVEPLVTPSFDSVPTTSENTSKIFYLRDSLIEHTGAVHAVAISPDGQTLVSGSIDKSVKTWSLGTGGLLRSLSGHTGAVHAVAISPDGQTLVSGSSGDTVKIWNLHTGKLLHTLEHTGGVVNKEVTSVAISPDGQTLVSGSTNKTVKVWNLHTGKLLRTLMNKGVSNWVKSVAISPDGQTLVSGLYRTINIWNLHSGVLLGSLTANSNRFQVGVDAVAISPDGQTLVSGSSDNTVKVWNLQTRELLFTIPANDGALGVNAVAISPDGQMIISGGSDRAVKVWHLHTGELLYSLPGHTGEVTSVAISPDGQTLVSGSFDTTIKIWGTQGVNVQ